MKKVYHLSTCNTCQRIIASLSLTDDFVLQDIKTNSVTEEQLVEMKNLAGSYESLFSRRAMKYRSLGLDKMELHEEDYKKYILEEYTFLKRPVFIIDQKIFIGNSKKTIETINQKISSIS